jgi:hypothetical protein
MEAVRVGRATGHRRWSEASRIAPTHRGRFDVDHPPAPHANSRGAWLQVNCSSLRDGRWRPKKGGFIVERDERGHWLPGSCANPGGRPGVPEVIKTTLRELSPRAVERLGQLLESDDERIQLEAAKAILDRHLGRPAIQADISLHRGIADDHLEALIEMARKRRAEPIDLDERDVVDITPCGSDPK